MTGETLPACLRNTKIGELGSFRGPKFSWPLSGPHALIEADEDSRAHVTFTHVNVTTTLVQRPCHQPSASLSGESCWTRALHQGQAFREQLRGNARSYTRALETLATFQKHLKWVFEAGSAEKMDSRSLPRHCGQ